MSCCTWLWCCARTRASVDVQDEKSDPLLSVDKDDAPSGPVGPSFRRKVSLADEADGGAGHTLAEEIRGSAAGGDSDIIVRVVTRRKSVGSAPAGIKDAAGTGERASPAERDADDGVGEDAAELGPSLKPWLLSITKASVEEMSSLSDAEEGAAGCGGDVSDRAAEGGMLPTGPRRESIPDASGLFRAGSGSEKGLSSVSDIDEGVYRTRLKTTVALSSKVLNSAHSDVDLDRSDDDRRLKASMTAGREGTGPAGGHGIDVLEGLARR